jgi:broad-specificity NMP kinase
MTNILITGIQGSGKTAVADELKKHDFNVIDTDLISRWTTKSGVPLAQKRPAQPSKAWLNSHMWAWDQGKLQSLLSKKPEEDAIFCAISWGQSEYYSLFDQVIVLKVSSDVLEHRLANRVSGNFGKNPEELAFILEEQTEFYKNAELAGALTVYAGRPLEQVVAEIIRLVKH